MIHKRALHLIVVLAPLVATLIIAACSQEHPTAVTADAYALQANEIPVDLSDPTDALNQQLRSWVFLFSGGQGFEFFQLPDSDNLSAIPQDPLNPLTAAKVALGNLLFHEVALGINNVRAEGHQTYACASCHPAQSSFFSPLPQAIAEGGSGFGTAGEARVLLAAYDSSPDEPDVGVVRAPSPVNIAYQQLAMRDGRLGGVGENIGTSGAWNPGDGSDANSLGHHGTETQAFAGLVDHRMGDVDLSPVAADSVYQLMFAAAFPGNPVVDRYNAALALAAYERTLLTNQAPFQRWLRGARYAMSDPQLNGAILFFSKAACITCHTGPSLSSMQFFAIGMHDLDNAVDPRVDLTRFGGTVPDRWRKGRGGFTGNAGQNFRFKVPQLYNIKDADFYGHGSSFATVRDVIVYYNAGVKENPHVPQPTITPLFRPLGLTAQEVDDLTDFVENALYDPNMTRYLPESLPTGNCYPAADPQSLIDLGCGGPTTLSTFMRRRPLPDRQR